MNLFVVFAIACGIGIVLSVVIFVRMARRPTDFQVQKSPLEPLTLGGSAHERRVGAWIAGTNVTHPIARLRFDADVAKLTGGLTGPVWIARSEVTAVEPVSGAMSSGFAFVTADGRLDRVAIWAGGELMYELAALGWPVVNQAPRSITRETYRI